VDIAILPDEQGRGAGSAVLRGLQALAGAQRLALTLAVNRANTGARRLYRRLGFRPDAEDALQEQLAWRAP
ncbi:MAG: GNAT family N-acetyltransferase, partial [Janthinobacterium sp.]